MYFCLAIVPSACSDPGGIQNGQSTSNFSDSSQFPVGTEVTFRCLAGYKLAGPMKRQCRTDGTWSESENPKCERKKHGIDYNTLLFIIKDDFQSVVLRALKRFLLFCFM